MGFFDIFRNTKKDMSYEELWERAEPKDGVKAVAQTTKKTEKKQQKQPAAKEAEVEAPVKKSGKRPEIKGVDAQSRIVATQKAKQIHGNKPFGIRTVMSLEKSVEARFETFKRTVDDLVMGIIYCVLIYGTAGVGKSWTVEQILTRRGMEKGKDYTWLTSKCTPAALYETALRYRNGGIIVMDDVNLKENKGQMMEILKSMTDTYENRTVVWNAKGLVQVSDPKEAEKLAQEFEKGESKTMPSQFSFKGKVIIITNLIESDFDDALLSRAMNVPLFLTEDEKLEHMKLKLREIRPEMDLGLKEEVLNYLIEFHAMNEEINKEAGVENLERTQLDLRTLVQALNIAEKDDRWRERMYLL
jgi:hypothetical protein